MTQQAITPDPRTDIQLAFFALDSMRDTLSATATPATGTHTITAGPEPDLAAYDLIIAGLSGKDGHAMLDVLATQTRRAGVFDRLYTVHADLGLMEWPAVTHHGRRYPSNAELVEHTANHYGVPPKRQITTHRVVTDHTGARRAQTLLEQVATRRMYPDAARRWCSSDFKISKIRAALTPLVRHHRRHLDRPVRILNVTGLRAAESAQRASRPMYGFGYANGARHQDEYLPVHHLSTAQVRTVVDESGCPHHWAYDSEPGAGDWRGSSRVSCSLCILGSKADVILAARRRPRLARLYAEVEQHTGHTFKPGLSMAQILVWATASDGPQPGVVVDEDTAAFHALVAAVRAQLANPIRLRRPPATPPPCPRMSAGDDR